MRRFLLAAVLGAAAVGCGREKKFEPREATEEEKRKVMEEDKKTQDDESYGNGPGVKGKGKAKK